ncbi:MAG TPA: hypothetical protein VHF22_11645, partial [Planctomycetota bacterium]|nr:hypothetical protein [Planctomycetota bacterium]
MAPVDGGAKGAVAGAPNAGRAGVMGSVFGSGAKGEAPGAPNGEAGAAGGGAAKGEAGAAS